MRRLSLLAIAALLSTAVPALAATTYVKAGRLLDVESGRLLADQAIVIEDTRITAIGPAANAGAQAMDRTEARTHRRMEDPEVEWRCRECSKPAL